MNESKLMASTNQPVAVTMNEQGRIVVPARIRKQLGLAGGDTLLIRIEDDAMRLSTPMANLRRMQRVLAERHRDDPRRWSDELIAERRAEAQREQGDLDAHGA